MSALKVNLDLVRKYNVPGPRYTSYPPATHFSESVSWEQVSRANQACNKPERDLSLYFHIPFCPSQCWYCGCTNVITQTKSDASQYMACLEKEMRMMAALLDPRRKVAQVHLGGGSPSFLAVPDLQRLGELVHSLFQWKPAVEASIEVDPRQMSPEQVEALKAAGFNRVSIGVQDFAPEVQLAVHRIQSFELVEKVAGWFRKAGFHSINFDLIYGLPYQTPESFDQTLDKALSLQPDRFAIFNYAHLPSIKPHQLHMPADALPSPETKLGILKMTIEKLTSRGYVYIGMDHFAREGDELVSAQQSGTLQRNFQGYSTCGGVDIHAFGMSSISQSDVAYWQNHKDLAQYQQAVEQGAAPMAKGYLMTPNDRMRRETIQRLMCDMGLNYSRMSSALNMDFTTYFSRELESLAVMEEDGLLTRSASRLMVTDLGRLLIRNIAMKFDAFLPRENASRYSKTI